MPLFLVPYPLFLRRHIIYGTVNPFTVIPGFYILENCPAGFLKVLIDMKIDFLLLYFLGNFANRPR